MTTALGIGTRNKSVHEPLVRAPPVAERWLRTARSCLAMPPTPTSGPSCVRWRRRPPPASGVRVAASFSRWTRRPAGSRPGTGPATSRARCSAQTAALGGLNVQLVYYRGFREFGASAWLSNTEELLQRMTSVFCLGGYTRIARVLRHALAETAGRKVNALVFVGDCMEEDRDELCQLAGELGLLALPAFIFHEGDDAAAGRAFREIARLSGGAYCRFDATSARQLRELLSAVAVYAAGGWHALEGYGQRTGGLALQVTHQIAKR